MHVLIFRFIFPFLAALLSGVLLFLAFPVYNLGWLGWVCLVPLLMAIIDRKPLFSLLLAYACGILFFVGIFDWILDAPGYEIIHHGILAVYLGSYVGLFGLAVSFISARRDALSACFAAPFIWISLEFIRSNLSFLALPWPLIAHTQYQNRVVIQVASLVGAYGVGFLVVAVNSAITLATRSLVGASQRTGNNPFRRSAKRGTLFLSAGVALLLGLSIAYGKIILSDPVKGREIRISVLQGNIERGKKWDPRYAKEIMRVYDEMTKEGEASNPALIIWPEAATPRSITIDPKLYAEVEGIAKTANTPILLGSTHFQKIRGTKTEGIKYRNSAFLIEPESKGESQRYDKIRLLPFGEYVPMRETIPWSFLGVPDLGDYIAGKEFTVFEGPQFSFSVAICWESIFSDLIREFVNRGAQVIINLTNEGWFGETAPYQFLAWNVFRAVENRVYVVRCANTGISCFINPYGHIVDRVKDNEGRDILVRGVLTGTVVPLESKTLYTQFGDWLVWLSFCVSGGIIFLGFLRKKPDQ